MQNLSPYLYFAFFILLTFCRKSVIIKLQLRRAVAHGHAERYPCEESPGFIGQDN